MHNDAGLIAAACRGERSCDTTLGGVEQALCRAYKEDAPCGVLDGQDMDWCRVMKEGWDCFVAFDGPAELECHASLFPERHLFWKGCGTHH
jgi:hypothetical protein